MSVPDRFAAQVRADESGCVLWTSATNRTGYGRFTVQGKLVLAHRFAWQIAHGPVPAGLCVLHRCDVRRCVNVSHLWIGTHRDNTQDMVQKGRDAQSRKTACPQGHPYDEANTYWHRGDRHCHTCLVQRARDRRAADPEAAREKVRVYLRRRRAAAREVSL